MTDAGGFAIVAAGGYSDPRLLRSRVEKPSSSNGLRQERQGRAESSGGCASSRRHRRLSQIDTAAREPLWNGPSLNAAFAAQLIGQVLGRGAGRDAGTALAAYRDRDTNSAPRVMTVRV
jgi:hypothetical protein